MFVKINTTSNIEQCLSTFYAMSPDSMAYFLPFFLINFNKKKFISDALDT